MPDETPYRIAIIAIAVLTMPIGLYHRLQAASGERISHREEGYLFAAALRLVGLTAAIAMLAYLIHPPLMQWGAMPLPAWLRWSGLLIGLFCPLLMYWTLSHLGKNLTDTVVTRRDATLVTSGPYRWVRHPFYVTGALLLLSLTLLAANAAIGAAGLLALGLLAVRTPKEEEMLLDRFGEAYAEYMSRTGRFFPRWGS